MRIGIDARQIANRRGIGNLVFHLLHGLSEIPEDCSFVIYVDDPAAANLIPRDARFTVKALKPKLYPAWEQLSLPISAASDRIDVLHCPGNTGPVFLGRQARLVLSIMDVMYLLPATVLPKSPSLYQRIGREYLRRIVPIVARRAAAIVTISASSRNDIVRHLGIPKDRISVVLLAARSVCRSISDASLLESVCAKYALRRPFVLALGAIDPRKNTARILQAFARFKRRFSSTHQLLLIGLNPKEQIHFRKLAQSCGIGDDVVLHDFVSDSDLVALYNVAEMLLYPSLYEGFGLPVLEAMACGTPVVTSQRGSLPEVAGDSALMVDPLDVDQIAGSMASIAFDTALRRDLVAKGKVQAGKFSWQRTAEQTFAIYKSVVCGS